METPNAVRRGVVPAGFTAAAFSSGAIPALRIDRTPDSGLELAGGAGSAGAGALRLSALLFGIALIMMFPQIALFLPSLMK